MGTINHPDYIPIAINSRIETDDILGPLPDNWEKSEYESSGRFYFVNHAEASTTWIDPRTFHIRKHNIDEIVAGELPYGWEESFDESVGIFYVDHITQSHFLDAPWDPAVREQVFRLRETLDAETQKLQDQIEAEQLANESELAETDQKLKELEIDRLALEAEANGIQQALNDSSDLTDLQLRNNKLDADNTDALLAAQAANAELEEVRALIESEAAQRRELEEYITRLKTSVLEMSTDPELVEELRRQDETITAEALAELSQLEKEMEGDPSDLATLRARLEFDRAERARLIALASEFESSKNAAEQDPEYAEKAKLINAEWLKRLNTHAQMVGTLRIKREIVETKPDPDELGFKEKLQMFAKAAIDEGEVPKLPEAAPTNPTNDFAVKARETAYGNVSASNEDVTSDPTDPAVEEDEIVEENKEN
ncbi:hypothetical protein HK096_007046 [Nowakowskiella sp. JEL0078]|nr:hypothetical protein HK096_007046 [Nowakowskiella sp. JEL0078]